MLNLINDVFRGLKKYLHKNDMTGKESVSIIAFSYYTYPTLK